ncbi:hypothetical protein [Eisenibacter elegans]|jgi:hypothetical protein|uniref:hypothetical protein n=1 Tax=Eisenibacter elegans TaxID=997 RepID=UPI0004207419|nr:hypothetical protein [Eisenibacter elegans]
MTTRNSTPKVSTQKVQSAEPNESNGKTDKAADKPRSSNLKSTSPKAETAVKSQPKRSVRAKKPAVPSPVDIPISVEAKNNTHIFYEHFNLDYAKSLAKFVLEPLNKFYFRATFVGFDDEEYPERNNPAFPLIFASNHSGMAFPWDAVVFASGLLDLHNYDIQKATRAFVTPYLSKINLMNPFLIPNFWKKAGAIDATMLNFETMMHYGESNLLIYPEGVQGIGKGFNHKYEIQRLSTSALRMSIKYRTDIIPFATVNAEYINPYSYSIKEIDNLVKKLGIPFLPIGPMLPSVLLQPWMFYFALPAKLTFVRGRRIRPYEMIDKPYEDITQEDLYKIRDEIHTEMQARLDEAVQKYGQKPYDWEEFFTLALMNWKQSAYFAPFAWPFIFHEHEKFYKEYHEAGKVFEQALAERKEYDDANFKDALQKIWQVFTNNPQVLPFYVPVAGLIYMVIRGLETPPAPQVPEAK